jgi:NADPH:quinone reductase-like Zn-dependent oxidoreductase
VKAGIRVVAIVRSKDVEFARSLGAKDIWDYESRDFEDTRYAVDAIIDTVGGDTQEHSFRFLKSDGILVSVVSTN